MVKMAIPDDGESVIVSAEEWEAVLPPRCPHRGGLLYFGKVIERSRRVVCPMHGATFDIASGKAVAGPRPCGDLDSRLTARALSARRTEQGNR